MPAEQAAGEVGAGVADPGTEKDERVREHPVREEPRAVDEAHEHGRVQEAEDRRRDLSRVEPRKREDVERHHDDETGDDRKERDLRVRDAAE